MAQNAVEQCSSLRQDCSQTCEKSTPMAESTCIYANNLLDDSFSRAAISLSSSNSEKHDLSHCDQGSAGPGNTGGPARGGSFDPRRVSLRCVTYSTRKHRKAAKRAGGAPCQPLHKIREYCRTLTVTHSTHSPTLGRCHCLED